MIYTVNSLKVKRGEREVLKGLDFNFSSGEFFAVLGSNGAGKSTLLKAMTSELPLSSGSIFLDEQNISLAHLQDQAKVRSVLPQNCQLNFDFPVREVVLMGRSPYAKSWESDEDIRIAIKAMEKADVSHLMDKRFTQLSGGEQQRVCYARSLAQIWSDEEEAKFLFLDEPVSNLDPEHQQRTLRSAKALSKRNVGVLAILHDPNLAAAFADRIMLLHEGKVFAIGSPEEVLTVENLQTVFSVDVEVVEHPRDQHPLIIHNFIEK